VSDQVTTARQFSKQRGSTRVVFGSGALASASAELERLGVSRVLLIGTKGRGDRLSRLARDLQKTAAGVLTSAREHVPVEVAAEGVEEARRLSVDAVFALGGGSAIGLAKAIALELPVKVICAPTTYSGSEMTAFWGRSAGGKKTTGRDERVRASLVIYDPDLTRTLPANLAATSGWNAMAHAVEALWARGVDPEVASGAEESLRLFAVALPRLLAGKEDANCTALEAAYLAACALADSTIGLHHKICHVLGGLGLPHAATHATVLPHVVRFNRDYAPAMTRIGRALGADDPVAAMFDLARRTGVLVGLEALGFRREQIDGVVQQIVANPPQNPRSLDPSSLRALLEGALHGEPVTNAFEEKTIQGFGAAMESEAVAGAVPRTQNAPRLSPHGLYPELVSGVPFTTRRVDNTRLWLYRIRPSSDHSAFERLPPSPFGNAYRTLTPNRIRWKPMAIPAGAVDFLDGLATLGGYGDPGASGYAVHLYAASASMGDRSFVNADGDLLIVPQEGALLVRSECGVLRVSPGELLLMPRGVRFKVDLEGTAARGYVGEVMGARFKLPERGPLGSNGLADARHFSAPVAAYEDRDGAFQLVHKIGGELWAATQNHSPFDVVGWHGNHVPYKYDLKHFNAMGSVTFDHPDPSIHTVLTAPLDDHGRALCDFVCFRGRWDVIEHSFRPPFAHRNAASEVNGIVRVASVDDGYVPGCTFLTPLLTSHGVATSTYEAIFGLTEDAAEKPRRLSDDSLWIMFESALPFRLTAWAEETPLRDTAFLAMFANPKRHFERP
jgi:homogentisate 1,2-dioxygenase